MVYGNLNENLVSVQQRIAGSDDLMKLLFYKDLGDILGDEITFPTLDDDEWDSLIKGKTQKIFPFKKIPQTGDENEFGCFISMEYGLIERSFRQQGGKGSSIHYKRPNFYIYILVPESLESTKNGSRLLSMEQCIEDAFHGKPLQAISYCYVGNSDTIPTANGYIGRRIPLMFVDKNEGVWNG